MTDFLEASSLPGNVLTHRSREDAGKMFGVSLASRSWEEEMADEDIWGDLRKEDPRKGQTKFKRMESKLSDDHDLMFCMDIDM